jgi:SP family arabinose:H+ symporter-like MFS transporter
MAHASQPDLSRAADTVKAGAPSNWTRTLAAAICSLGGMTFGYDLGAMSGATQGLMHSFVLSPALFGLTMSASLWGALCASLIAGRLADIIGRRGLLAGCALFYALAAGGLASPISLPWILALALRLLSGITVGGFVVGCPLYLAEIAPRALRGRFVGWFQVQIGTGVVLAFIVSDILVRTLPEAAVWKWCFGLGAVPSVCLLALLHWVPEEPHWLAGRGRWLEARSAADRLDLSNEEWPRQGDAAMIKLASPSSQERLFCRKYLRLLMLATSIALFNQLCGVNILRVYLLDLLSSSGMGPAMSHTYAVLISCLNLVALMLGMMVVDRLGRKPLLVVGSAGMSLCMLALSLAIRNQVVAVFYLVILVAYNTFFAFWQGAVAWVYLSEIFPFSVRGKGQSYGASVHWLTNAALIWIFPVLQHAAPQASFLLFAFMMVLQVVIVLRWYPETKGTRLGAVAEVAEHPEM